MIIFYKVNLLNGGFIMLSRYYSPNEMFGLLYI